MPAQVEYFSSVKNLPTSTYWDTSYILDLIRYSSEPRNKKYKEAKSFYEKLRKNNIPRYTSILAVEEAIYFILYTTGIKEDIKTYTSSTGKKFRFTKDFKNKELIRFQTSHKTHMARVLKFLTVIKSLGLILIYPKEFKDPRMPQISKRITDYATALLNKHELEPKDAFHIAIARCARIEAIVSNDTDFKDIDGIKLYCFK